MCFVNFVCAGAASLVVGHVSFGMNAFTLPSVTRDFHMVQTDFEVVNFSPNGPAGFFANDQTNKIEKLIVGPVGSSLGGDGTPVYSPVREAGFYNTVSSAASFYNWFHDVAGTNVPVNNFALPFTDNNNGTYTFDNQSFFPLDGLGYGNEGQGHNYHFTIQSHARFTYQPGQTFSVVGDDDIWVFIDKRLAIDVGGIHGTLGGVAELDTLGLTPGQAYDLDLFFTERNRYGSTLNLSTNIRLPEPTTLVTATAVLALAGRRTRRG